MTQEAASRSSEEYSTPFPHLTGTWGLPTPNERQMISTLIDSDRAELVGAEGELIIARKRFEEAQSRVNGLKASITTHARILSSSRRIPPEVWEEIFAITIFSQYTDVEQWPPACYWESPERDAVVNAPWILSVVCKKWREIALSYPVLWTHYKINQVKLSASQSEAIATQLVRSKDANLYIYVGWHLHYGYADLAELFATHIHRCQSLYAPSKFLMSFREMLSLPRIKRLSTSIPFHCIRHSTELSQIRLILDDTSAAFPNFFKYSETVSLDVAFSFAHDLFALLTQLHTKLISLSIFPIDSGRAGPYWPSSHVLFPNLQSLSLGPIPNSLYCVNEHILAPRLKSLSLSFTQASYIPSVTDLITRSSCTLTEFQAIRLHRGPSLPLIPPQLLRILLNPVFTDNIEQLGIQGVHVDQLLIALSMRLQKPTEGKDSTATSEPVKCILLYPKLGTLELLPNTTVSESILLDFLDCYRTTCTTLHTISFTHVKLLRKRRKSGEYKGRPWEEVTAVRERVEKLRSEGSVLLLNGCLCA